ncbi:hypothetical protein Tco_1577521 [Tanacetum coccineum]
MVPWELMESVRTDIDVELNRLVEMQKKIEDDHERKKLEIAEEHKRNKAELEDILKEIEDQHNKLLEDAVEKLIQKLPPRVVRYRNRINLKSNLKSGFSVCSIVAFSEEKFMRDFVLPYHEVMPSLYENYINATGLKFKC